MKKTFFYLLLLLSTTTFAADIVRLNQLFSETFWTLYQPNYCGRNIESFSGMAVDSRIDLKNAYVMEIRNAGFDTFGLVAALAAREEGRLIEPKPVIPPFRHIGYSNWNFHVVALADGFIYDYDFLNSATVMELSKYLDEMFIPTEKRSNKAWKTKKIGSYKISLYPVKEYLQAIQNRTRMSEIAAVHDKYLKDYLPSYFK